VCLMKRFRFRKLIFASAIGVTLGAVTLGTAVLSEAAGPRQILSGLWDRRPKLSNLAESRLNPRTWANSPTAEKLGRVSLSGLVGRDSSVKTGKGQTVSASRPDLYEDPFAVSGESTNSVTSDSSAIARRSAAQAAPSPRQRREKSRSEFQSFEQRRDVAADNRATVDDGTRGLSGQDVVRRTEAPNRTEAPKLPNGLEGASVTRSSPGPRDSRNQFSDGFDQEFQRLIKSVIAETEATTSGGGDNELPVRRLTDNRDALRSPVSAPRFPTSQGGQSPLGGGASSVENLIESGRRDMATAMTLPMDAGESPLIMAHPDPTSISLTEAQTQVDGRPAMMVPSMQSSGGTSRADLRNGWTGDSLQDRELESDSRINSIGAMRPRVISNGAPARSVPNNRQYERTSYSSKEDGPLFGEPVQSAQRVTAGLGKLDAVANPRDLEGVSSAPIIDWSLDSNSSEPATARSIPWGFASVLVTAVTTLLAILLLRKRQVVTVVTSGTDPTSESD
jgi:hypothetical protein